MIENGYLLSPEIPHHPVNQFVVIIQGQIITVIS